MGQFKRKMANQDEKYSLHPQIEGELNRLKKVKQLTIKGEPLTLSSTNAKFLPRQVLGPFANVNRCLYPCTSAALPTITAVGSLDTPSSAVASSSEPEPNHRLGSNVFASSPHRASDLFTPAMGMRTTVPLATKMLSTSSPDAVRIGCESGTTSSSCAFEM